MHPALRKGPLFYITPPPFSTFLNKKTPPLSTFFTKNTTPTSLVATVDNNSRYGSYDSVLALIT